MIREKRQHPRARVDQPCTVEHGAATLGATLRDISVGGAYVESTQTLPFGDDVTLVFAQQGETAPLRIKGVVRWSQSDGFGLQFGLLGARETFAITQLIKQQKTLQS